MSTMMEEMWTFMQKLRNNMVDANTPKSKGKLKLMLPRKLKGIWEW
jgi:hypothetical protein